MQLSNSLACIQTVTCVDIVFEDIIAFVTDSAANCIKACRKFYQMFLHFYVLCLKKT